MNQETIIEATFERLDNETTNAFAFTTALNLHVEHLHHFPIAIKQIRPLITAICTRRQTTNTPATISSRGWQRWINVDTTAAIKLLNPESNSTITKNEYKTFIQTHPFLLGPLTRIQRAFQAYDTDHNGYLNVDEVCVLMRDMEAEKQTNRDFSGVIEQPAVSANAVCIMMNCKIRTYFKKYVKKKKRGFTFFEFALFALEHPETLQTTPSLRPFFQEQDVDKDGFLSTLEVTRMIEKFYVLRGCTLKSDDLLITATTKTIMEIADLDQDERVDFLEFMTFATLKDSPISLIPMMLSFDSISGYDGSFRQELDLKEVQMKNASPQLTNVKRKRKRDVDGASVASSSSMISSSSSSSSSICVPPSTKKSKTNGTSTVSASSEFTLCSSCCSPVLGGFSKFNFIYCSQECEQTHQRSSDFQDAKSKCTNISSFFDGSAGIGGNLVTRNLSFQQTANQRLVDYRHRRFLQESSRRSYAQAAAEAVVAAEEATAAAAAARTTKGDGKADGEKNDSPSNKPLPNPWN